MAKRTLLPERDTTSLHPLLLLGGKLLHFHVERGLHLILHQGSLQRRRKERSEMKQGAPDISLALFFKSATIISIKEEEKRRGGKSINRPLPSKAPCTAPPQSSSHSKQRPSSNQPPPPSLAITSMVLLLHLCFLCTAPSTRGYLCTYSWLIAADASLVLKSFPSCALTIALHSSKAILIPSIKSSMTAMAFSRVKSSGSGAASGSEPILKMAVMS